MTGEKNALLAFHHNTEEVLEFVLGLKKWGNYNFYAFGPVADFLERSGVSVVDISSLVDVDAVIGLSLDPIAWIEEVEKEEGIGFIDLVAFDFWSVEKMMSRPKFIHEDHFGVSDNAKPDRIIVCDDVDYEKVVDWVMEHCPRKKTFLDYLYRKADETIIGYRSEVYMRFHSNA